jgi:O-antigen/teichoic acid export membrane protein
MIKKLLKRIKCSEFANHFKILATGTLLSQIILVITSPFITRLYSPEVFGIFSLFVAIVSVVTPIACGRYNVALVVAKEKNGESLFVLCLIVGFAVSLFLLMILFIGEEPLKKLLNAEKLHFWWYMIPLVVFLQSIFIALSSYANRYKNYSIISKTSVAKSIISVLVILALGFSGFSSNGLFIAEVLSSIIIIIFLIWIYRNFFKKLTLESVKELVILAKKYKKFPLYQASSTSINSLRGMLPIFFLSYYFPSEFVGYYALVLKVIFFPLSFISNSVSMLHLKKVSEIIHNKSNAVRYLISITLILTAIIIVPMILIIVFGPQIFSFIFGLEWTVAGEFASILMPGLSVIFIVSALSPVFASTGNLMLSAIWYVVFFIFQFILFFVFSEKITIKDLLLLLTIVNIVFYIIFYFLIYFAVTHPKPIT